MAETKQVLHILTPFTSLASEHESREVEQCPPLSELQELVGGLIELVRVNFRGKVVDMLVNEEGLIMNLPVNAAATALMRESYEGYGYIVGVALVFEGFTLP